MDDRDIEPTPNDPEFDPYECESTYALWAFKEEGEPVKFLEASLVAQSLLSTGLHHMQNRCFDTVTRDPADTRFMDTSKVTKLFAEELGRDTGLALDAALKGKHARHYSRDAYALIFPEADLDEYAELIDLDCPDLDAKQRREVAATAVREWCRDHAMDGFSVFFHDYAKEHARSAAEKQVGGIRH